MNAPRSPRTASLAVLATIVSLGTAGLALCQRSAVPPVLPRAAELVAEASQDQDDLCIWRDETDPSRSLFIGSDKVSDALFVFDMNGALTQTIEIPTPGNIDIRQGVRWNDRSYDVVVVNSRRPQATLQVFIVDPESRQLRRVDKDILTDENYGGCLAYNREQGRLFFLCTSKDGGVCQYELSMDDNEVVTGTLSRRWQIGCCEGAVADDDRQTLYIAEERGTIWKLGIDPESPLPGEALTAVGQLGLQGDLEGLALLHVESEPAPLLVASDQGRDLFVILTTEAPVRVVAEFLIEGAEETDGIDIHQAPLGPNYPNGVMVCHTNKGRRSPIVVDLARVLNLLEGRAAKRSP